MFKVPEVTQSKLAVTVLDFAAVVENIKCNKRAGLDLRTRHAILTHRGEGTLLLKTGDMGWDHYYGFWSKYAEVIGVKVGRSIYKDYPAFPSYTRPDQSVGYFTSDSGNGRPGFESLMMANTLYADAAINLSNVDHEEPMVHMLEGFLAIVGPAMGFACTFIGDEKYSGSDITFSHRESIEQTEWWWREWNKYLGPQNSIQSVCGAMHKDDIVLTVTSSTPVAEIGSCDLKDTVEGGWCGNCWKCCSTSYILWAYRGETTIPVSVSQFEETLLEQKAYRRRGSDIFRSLGLLERVERRTGKSLIDFADYLHSGAQRTPVQHISV